MTTLAASRFGDRIERGPAASFRCARCGELAGVVRVARAGTTVNMGPPLDNETPGRDGLVLDYFLGRPGTPGPPGCWTPCRRSSTKGNVDPAAIRDIGWALREVTPFYCPDCGLNYCSRDWDTFVVFDEGFYDCAEGTCPNRHRHVLDD